MPMMGKIININDDIAEISMQANAACGDCNACSHGTNDSKHNVEAINSIDAKLGDTVEFDLEVPSMLGAAFIAYTIPLITMVGSIAISLFIFKNMGNDFNGELYASLIGFTTLILTLGIIKLFDKKMKDSKRFMAKITKVVINSNQEVFFNVKK
ncbi:MAG: SoxR reducing system RseC family protein [Clostridiales bacterium]|nr:SoxR reducing system RseC family protein [Clostridiales bacterium]